jgi:hypothetical protein
VAGAPLQCLEGHGPLQEAGPAGAGRDPETGRGEAAVFPGIKAILDRAGRIGTEPAPPPSTPPSLATGLPVHRIHGVVVPTDPVVQKGEELECRWPPRQVLPPQVEPRLEVPE